MPGVNSSRFTKGDPRASIASKKATNKHMQASPDLRFARQHGKLEVESLIWKHFRSNDFELRNTFKNPATPVLEKIICSLMIASIDMADEKRLNFLLERTIGKVADKIEHFNGPDQSKAVEKSFELVKALMESRMVQQVHEVIDVTPVSLVPITE